MDGIKEGDVVGLTVNDMYAPRMAVGTIEDGYAECYWFVGKELKQARISVVALKKK